MEQLTTDDGSKTFRNPIVDELYHTKAGAIVEALEKHARALKVWEKENPIIFDVCSGLSYSAACALEEIRNHKNTSFVTIYLFENDRKILEKNLQLENKIKYIYDGKKQEIKSYEHFKNAIRNYLKHNINIYQAENIKIIILYGDVNLTIEKVEETADFIFYAPFSPQFTPKMWTSDIFKKLYSHMAKNGKLSTYSYARKVRDALIEAKFKIVDGPTLGRRSPSLIGIKE
ncbi:MAG: MnmC family methyltransferase [Candidatus Woesearchaeota archaeon]